MSTTVARQIGFWQPTTMRGKWHAAWLITRTPVCGANVELSDVDVIRTAAGDDAARVHPIVCRRCLRLTTSPGRTAQGVER